VRVRRAARRDGEDARAARDGPDVDRRVGVDVAHRAGVESRRRRSVDALRVAAGGAARAGAGRGDHRGSLGAEAVLEDVDVDAGERRRVDDGRRGAVLERTAVAEVVRVAVVPLRLEADFTGEAGEAVLLLEEGLLGGEDRLRVRLGLALLRARLELDEVRNGDGREDADDRNDDHQLDQRKAFLQLFEHGWTPVRGTDSGTLEQAMGQARKRPESAAWAGIARCVRRRLSAG